MGEIVFNNKEMAEMRKEDGIAKWERFLQRMSLRVLLVEADDSTRQIVTALLKKSSYRVTAVPDGLKAWEILKGRPHNIDLILTEVDLPSISGFALLTLIMEHEICKNIPVIMMSSQDSVSTVYKCMMRGAADYLVKPVRRNELRNLWQHVWRRKSSTVGGIETQDESVGQQKIEATSENDTASNHSSGYMAFTQRKEEYMEKGSDEQSSCTKPDFEAESVYGEDMPDLSRQLWGRSLQNDLKMQNHASCVNYCQKSLMPEPEAQGSEVAACKEANTRTNLVEDIAVNSPREVIDFMGAFKNYKSPSTNSSSKFDFSPQLDLSLRRTNPDGFESQVTERKFTLGHSNASAFTRYTNRALEPQHTSLSGVRNTPVATLSTQRSVNSLANGLSKKSELAASSPQQRTCPVPVLVKGVDLNNICGGYGSAPHVFCAQSGQSTMQSPSSASQQELRVNPLHGSNIEYSNGAQIYEQLGENAINSSNQSMHKVEYRLDSLEDRGHISPATDQSTSSSFCNGARTQLNSMGYGSACGSNSNVDQAAAGRAAAESKNEEGLFPSRGNSNRSIHREAALTKFRLKRKDRCYDKKVRYESRKKLAEQRPRVKGQFVRQLHLETPPADYNNHYGDSADDGQCINQS